MSKMDVDIGYDLGFNHELEDRCEYVGTDTPQAPIKDKSPCLCVIWTLGDSEQTDSFDTEDEQSQQNWCNSIGRNLAQKINSQTH